MTTGTRHALPWIPAGMFLLALAACGSQEMYRRTAIIPAAYLPSRTGEPLAEYEVRIQGEANPVRLSRGSTPARSPVDVPTSGGEPGLLIPQAEVGGSVYFAPSRILELGGQFHWASYRWTRANAAGVLDFPEGMRTDVWQAGFGARLNFAVRRADLTFSPILEINVVRVPEAEFVDPSRAWPGQGYEPGWSFTRLRESTWCYPSVFLQVDQGFLDSTLHLHFLVGFQRTLQNVGFDWGTQDHSTVSGALAVPFALGLEYRYRQMVVGATFFYPLAVGSRLDVDTFGPSLALRLGVVLGGRPKAAPPPPRDAPPFEREPPAGGEP